MGAWIWEIVRVRNYDRSITLTRPLDWTDDGFVAIFFLFMLNWISSSLWQYIILYFLGCFSNSPRKAANYAVRLSDHSCKRSRLMDCRVYSVDFLVQVRQSALGSTPSQCLT